MVKRETHGACGARRSSHRRGNLVSGLVLGAALGTAQLAGVLALPSPAAACGGLFCNNSQPVNQAAERILFVDNGDGTTTAVIQIQYQGPSDRFAWVLPVPGIENPDDDITVSSDLALERLQARTNPQYTLVTRFEDGCIQPGATRGPALANGGAESASQDDGGVNVEASGSVGPFDWTLISVSQDQEDPAAEAVTWLEDNSYDVTAIGPDLLAPYLMSGNQLLAVRLSKGNDAGSIRPLTITYEGDKPSIPIRPTAVAANPDMGVMVWVGGQQRAIPKNYHLLELNEALIDWFNPNDTYNDVVTAAADEAGGHGFVTEYADRSEMLANVVVQQWERDQWNNFTQQDFVDPQAMYQQAVNSYQGWDGFRDALRDALTFPTDADFDVDDVMNCFNCFVASPDDASPGDQAMLDMDRFQLRLYELVIRPMFDTDDLLLSQAWVTRMYTTMSADEMDEDPVFDFNPDLEAVSNQHTAERVIACDQGPQGMPWMVELTGGIVVREDSGANVWPIDPNDTDMPASLRIFEVGTSGPPTVTLDNLARIVETEEVAASGNPDMSTMMPPDSSNTPDPITPGPGAGSGDDDGGLFCSVRTPGQDGRAPWRAVGLLAGLALAWRSRRA